MSHWHVRKRKQVRKWAGEPRGSNPTRPPAPPPAQPDLLDAQRAEFIRALDSADIQLTEWQAEFAASMYARTDLHLPFSEKMRVQIDRLIGSHGHRVAWSGRPKALQPVRSETRVAMVREKI